MSTAPAGCAPNRATLERPELTCEYGVQLFSLLSKRGYYVQCLPVLALLEVLAGDVLICRQRKLLQAWVHLETSNTLDALNISEAVQERQQMAQTISVSDIFAF